MRKTTFILTRVLLLFLVIYLIDGGKCLYIIGNNMHHLFVHELHTDFEVNNFSSIHDDPNWIDDSVIKPGKPSSFILRILPEFSLVTTDYSQSVWQPPKYL